MAKNLLSLAVAIAAVGAAMVGIGFGVKLMGQGFKQMKDIEIDKLDKMFTGLILTMVAMGVAGKIAGPEIALVGLAFTLLGAGV